MRGGDHRSGAADGAGHPRHPRPRAVPAAVLSRRLRRHGASTAADIDAAFIARHGGADQRHASVAARRVRGQPAGRPSWPAPPARKVVFDIDYRPVLWGLTAPRRRREPLRRRRGGHRAAARGRCRLCDLIVGTEEEFHILGGSDRHDRGPAGGPRTRPRALLVCKRGPHGMRRVRGRGRRQTSPAGVAAPGSTSRCSTCWAPATPSWPASCAAGCATCRSERCCDYANACGRHRGLAPRLRAGHAELVGAGRLPHRRRRGRSGCARTRRWSTCTGRTTRAGLSELFVLAIDHRSQFEDLARGAGRGRGARRRLQGAGAGGGGPASPAAIRSSACCWTAGSAPDALAPAADRPTGSAGRSRCPGRGRWNSRAAPTWPPRPARMAAEPVVKCLALYHPDDEADLRARQERQLRPAVRRLPQDAPRAAAGDHRRRRAWPATRTTVAHAHGAALRPRHPPGLVEAGADRRSSRTGARSPR